MVIRLMHGPKLIVQKAIEKVKVKKGRQLRVEDYLWEPRWSILWMRGIFEAEDNGLDKLEIVHNEKVIADAAIDEKFRPDGRCFFKWRVESVVEEPIRPREILVLRAVSSDGAIRKIRYTVPESGVETGNITSPGTTTLRYAETGNPMYQLDFIGSLPEKKVDHTILLIVHNLNAVERGEKKEALEHLRQALNEKGIELICLHHSRHPAGCEVPEINFYSEKLGKLSTKLQKEAEAAKEDELARANAARALHNGTLDSSLESPGEHDEEHRPVVDEETRNYAERMLYGFIYALNRRPHEWSKIKAQTDDELARIEATIKAVKPSLVLLWHQWNSLMILGRAIAERHNIPSAIIHEGMIPGTMTIDAHGMMAESDCTGAVMPSNGNETEPYYVHARHIIDEIRTKWLDRKPACLLYTSDAADD